MPKEYRRKTFIKLSRETKISTCRRSSVGKLLYTTGGLKEEEGKKKHTVAASTATLSNLEKNKADLAIWHTKATVKSWTWDLFCLCCMNSFSSLSRFSLLQACPGSACLHPPSGEKKKTRHRINQVFLLFSSVLLAAWELIFETKTGTTTRGIVWMDCHRIIGIWGVRWNSCQRTFILSCWGERLAYRQNTLRETFNRTRPIRENPPAQGGKEGRVFTSERGNRPRA